MLTVQRGATPQLVASRAAVAGRWMDRAIGLLKYRRMPEGLALIFPQCNSVHTVGMRFPIDLIFVDRLWGVVRAEGEVAPGRLIFPVKGAWAVVEAAAGTIQRLGVAVGDVLRFMPQT